MKKKRLIIDASSVFPIGSDHLSGIGRTTLELIKELEKQEDLPFEIILFGQRLSRNRYQRYGFEFPERYLRLPRWECFDWVRSRLPVIEILTGADLIHIPHNYAPVFTPQKAVVTIHDAIYLTHPEERFHSARQTTQILNLANNCKAIITCSESSKSDLIKYGRIKPEKIHVIYWGYNSNTFFKISNTESVNDYLKNKFDINSPFFLCVSCSVGRKNSPAVIDTFLNISNDKSNHELVMVWKHPPQDILNRIMNHPQGRKIRFISDLSDEDLRYVYNGALALVFPSSYEGFGLPVLEAMASGTPVITSSISSLPEIGGDAAIYITPADNNDLRQKMLAFTKRHYDLEVLSSRCLAQASRFSWQECAERTIELYNECLDLNVYNK